MTNQLSKAALKSTAELLAHLEARQAQTVATIAMLKTMLREARVPSAIDVNQNGHEPSIADRAAYDDLKERARVNSVVKKARAKFAARPAGRHTPGVWRKRILTILQNAEGQPVSARDIQRQMGVKSNVVFKHLAAAVNDGVISRTPGPKGFYVLGRHAATGRPAKKKRGGVTLNVKAQRQRSLNLLNTFDTETPKPLGAHWNSVGKLISHGYLKRTKDGYLRTAKVYEVTP